MALNFLPGKSITFRLGRHTLITLGFRRLETKINAPPRNIDAQDVPKSLERVIKLKNAVKNNLVQKRRKRRKGANKLIALGAEQSSQKLPHPRAKPEKVVPIFNQQSGENQYQFWQRVNRETHNFIKETEFETKYNVEVKRNAETGDIEGVVKKPKDELSELEKLRAKHKNVKKKKKKKVDVERTVKLSKAQKKREKLLKKREKRDQDDIDEFKTFKDKVEFGDVVHAPPQLKAHPRDKNQTVSKVGVTIFVRLLTFYNNQEKIVLV